MGNIFGAINDDLDEYCQLCKKYNETPHYKPDARGNLIVDCYSEHARRLKDRQHQEYVAQHLAKQAQTAKPVVAPVQKPEVFVNEFKQEIRPGDKVVCVTTGYSHSVKTRLATFAGVSKSGSPQVRYVRKKYNYQTKTHHEVEVTSTIHARRVYKLA